MSRIALAAAILLTSGLASAEQPFQARAGDRHKVRVTSTATARVLKDQGATRVARYETFDVFEVSGAAVQALAKDPGLEPQDDWYAVELNGGALDTRLEPAAGERQQLDAGADGRRLHLVQFVGPVQEPWVRQLEADGWRIVCYVPNNAYVVYGDAASRRQLQAARAARPQVQWTGALLDEEKIHPRARRFDAAGRPQAVDTDAYSIQLVLDPEANAATLKLIAGLQLAPVLHRDENERYLNLVVRLPADAVANVAAQPDVLSIHVYRTPKLMCERQGMIVSGNLAGNIPTGPGYLNWLYGKGFTQTQFTAAGFAVDVTDSGIDNASTNVNHFGLHLLGNLGQVTRVAYSRVEGTGGASGGKGCDGHGNLNAHIIGGYNVSNAFPHTDGAGYRYGLGICPFVRVGASVIFDPDYTYPDYENLISRAYRDGARISSDSWGADNGGDYDTACQQYDGLVRDAQPTGSAVPVGGNQEMTIVFAAGNAGPGSSTVGSPGSAKNVITVGAGENVQAFGGSDGSGISDSGADSAADMISFSSRGPCSDGRRKPELVAPGTHVSGGVGQQNATAGGTGIALSCFDGSGVSGGTGGSHFFPAGQQFFSASSGTSHSTPGVAGGCALVRQWFVNHGLNVPSPAMVKGVLMNSARYMNGSGANDTLLSNNQGMGGMNLGMAFDDAPRVLRDQLTSDLFTASGQSRIFTARVATNTRPVRVTLTWTDAPGSTVGNAYNNNLDLVVTLNGQTYRGNVFSGATSVSGGTADPRNNAESVFLPAGATGVLAIAVNGVSINSDGVPGNAFGLDQDFALVVYNAAEIFAPVIVPAGQQLAAETCGVVHNGLIDPLEQVTVKLALKNVGSANTTNLTATLLATGGVTAPSGPQNYGALSTAGNVVTNSFSFIATGLCGGVVSATLQLADGALSHGAVQFSFPIGTNATTARATNNAASILIPNSGNASPYPSAIVVAGTTGVISKVTATLSGFAHTWPEDVDVLLTGPGGNKVLLMSAAGDGTDVSGLSLTFDDDASGVLPSGAALTSGTFRPSDYSGGSAVFGAPAPGGPYGAELAAFKGMSPTGTWSLFVVDAASGDSGSIAQGWRLNLTLGTPRCCLSNQPPVFDAIGSKVIIQSNNLQFAVAASDPADGHSVTLTSSNLPSGALFFPTNGVSARGSFLWTNANPTGVFSAVFYATDVNGTVSEPVSITVLPAGVSGCGLIISEYVVASGNERAIELYNGTGAPINLGASNAYVIIHINGSNTLVNSVALTGTVAASTTYVITHASASAGLKAYAQQFAANLDMNGNDPVVLRTGGTNGLIQDSMGDVGNAVNNFGSLTTLVRRASVSSGDKNISGIFTNSTYWIGYSSGTYTNLGTHNMTCQGGIQGPPIWIPIGNQVVTLSNSLVLAVNALATDSDTATLSMTNAPSGATLAATNENGTFTWPVAAPLGAYPMTFFASDNDGVAAETITITVQPYVPPATNVLAWYPFEDAASNFTRHAAAVAEGVLASACDSGGAPSSEQPGNPLSALGSSGFTGDGDNYFTFGLHITPGRTLNVARIRFEDQKSTTGPSTWALRSSLDGFAADLANGGAHLSFTTNDIGLALDNLTGPLTFRLYGQSASSGGGTWRVDNLLLLGTFAGTGLVQGAAGLVITSAHQVVENSVAALPLGGVATTSVVGQLRWTNALNGAAGTLAAATNWLTPAIPLAVGANVITVRGTSLVAAAAADTRTLTRQAAGQAAGPQLILFQGFEPADPWAIAAGAGAISAAAGGADTPPGQRIRTGANSWQVNNQSVTLLLAQASMAGFTGRLVELRLACPAPVFGNGADSNDVLQVAVALDGAAFAAASNAEFTVSGNSNARWGFWATNQAFAQAGAPFPLPAPQPGADSNHFARLLVRLPDAATSLALRVWAFNNDAGELWALDDVAVTGFLGTNDADGDGLDDAWEVQQFGNLVTAGTNTDYDLDGLSDWAEFLSGTQPTNAASLLKAMAFTNAAAAGWIVQWQSVTEHLYRLSRSSDLLAGFSGVASNLPGTPPLNTYTDAVSTNALRFYRVELE